LNQGRPAIGGKQPGREFRDSNKQVALTITALRATHVKSAPPVLKNRRTGQMIPAKRRMPPILLLRARGVIPRQRLWKIQRVRSTAARNSVMIGDVCSAEVIDEERWSDRFVGNSRCEVS
jgi:hypothetical protein